MKFPIYDCRLPIETLRAPVRGERTRPACSFRRPAENFVLQTALAQIQENGGTMCLAGRQTPQAGGLRSPLLVAQRGFTMIEIALCLAIIGFALISILLVLPSGMHTQRDVRQETIISQDASMLLEAIRGGARGLDDLTNNVIAITNYYAIYNRGQPPSFHVNGYTYAHATLNGVPNDYYRLTNGAHIIGLLSTPEFVDNNGMPDVGKPISSTFGINSYISNHIYAYVRSFSGLAAEKPPQDNQIMQADTFAYQLLCVNAPLAADTNVLINPINGYARQLSADLRELRLTFFWPQFPNGNVGSFKQTFRTSVSGQLTLTNYDRSYPLYFYQPQSFTAAP